MEITELFSWDPNGTSLRWEEGPVSSRQGWWGSYEATSGTNTGFRRGLVSSAVSGAQVSRLGSTRFQNHPRVLEPPTWRFRKFYHKVPELPIRVLEPVALGFQTHTPWHSAVLEPCPRAQRQRFRKDECSDSRSMHPSAPPLA